MLKSLMILFISFCSFVNAQWKFITPLPSFSYTNKVFILSENEVFITSKDGVLYHSNDLGKNWETLQTEAKTNLSDIKFFDNGAGLIMGEHGIILRTRIRTSDKEKDWLVQNIGEDIPLFSLSIDKIGRAWISSENGDIFYSLNKGISWTKISTGFNYDITRLVFSNENVGYAIAKNSTETLLLHTSDSGISWDSKSISNQINELTIIGDSTILLGGDEILLKSTNSGDTWFTPNISRTYPLVVHKIQFLDDTIGFIASYNTIFKTNDGGENWTQLNLRHGNDLLDLYFFDASIGICIDFEGTIFSTINGGNTWSLLSGNMYVGVINSYKEDSVITLSDLTISYDNGVSWSMYMGDRGFSAQRDSKGNLWGYQNSGGWPNSYKDDLLESSDNGKTWIKKVTFNSRIWGIFLVSDENILLNVVGPNSGYNIYHYNTTSGELKIAFTYPPYIEKFYSIDKKNYLLCTNKLFISSDSGKTWSASNLEFNDALDMAIGLDNKIYILSKNNMLNIFSSDGSNVKTQNFYQNQELNGIVQGKGSLWLFGQYGTLLMNKNNDETWEDIYFPQNVDITKLLFSNSQAIASGSSHQLLINRDFITSIDNTNEISPSKFILFQNYPNPFNPTTIIKYQIPLRTYVKLEVYNILGEKINTLVDKEQLKGIYEVKFNNNNFSSGIYFYTIRTKDFIQAKKMILLK